MLSHSYLLFFLLIINQYQFVRWAVTSFLFVLFSHTLTSPDTYVTSHCLSICPPHLEQDADGGSHAHHADTHHRHFVPAANRLLLHHMADQLLLGGHLCKETGRRYCVMNVKVGEFLLTRDHTGKQVTSLSSCCDSNSDFPFSANLQK